MSVGNESWIDRLGLEEGESLENLDTGDQVDVICDAFERQWRDGTTQPVECFLEGTPVTEQTLSLLHQQLLPLEMEFRSDAGETISFRDYLERVPAQALFIARVLCSGDLDVELDPPLKKIGGYWLLEAVGRGSFGVVYRAYDRELDRFVAVKLPTTSLGDEESERRFQREARNAGRLAHPGIVPIYFVEQDKEGRPYIVSEFVEGTTLDVIVAEKGRFNAPAAASLVAQLAESLEYAHSEGIIHRDLKPSNVILEDRKIGDSTQVGTGDNSLRPKVLDFGLARRLDGDASTSIHGAVIGTPAYMSPEQARGDGGVDHRADIYGLGAILYELLFGQRCFPGEAFSTVLLQVISEEPKLPPAEAAPVPKDLITICMKCLNKEPAHRYSRAADLADDLRRWRRHEEIKARPLSLAAKTVRWVRRNAVLSAGIMTTVVLIAVIIFLSSSYQLRTQHRGIIGALESASPQRLDTQFEETLLMLKSVRGLRRAMARRVKESPPRLAIELRSRIVLGDDLPRHAERFYNEIDTIPIAELSILAKRLTDSVGLERLRERVRPSSANNGDGLHATVCLAALESDWPGFKELAAPIVDALVDSPEYVLWARALRPISSALLPPCRRSFTVPNQAETVAGIVVELAVERPHELIWFLARAPGPTTRILIPPIQSSQSLPLVKELLDSLMNLPPWHEAGETVRLKEAERLEEEVQQRVNLALCYAFAEGVEASNVLRKLLASDEDPRPRTYFIQRAHESVSLAALQQHLTWQIGVRDPLAEDVLFCVILALSQYEKKDLERESGLFDQLLEVYQLHPDSGVHCAAGYCLRKLNSDFFREHGENLDLEGERADRDWFHTSFGTCMIVIRPGTYQIWPGNASIQIGEVKNITIRTPFAVAATEMTEGEYVLLTTGLDGGREYDGTQENPHIFTDLISLEKLPQEALTNRTSLIDGCRQVDKQEKLVDNHCFEPGPENGVVACDLTKFGFRFPIAHEWLVCCSAGARTSRYFGSRLTDGTEFISDGRNGSYHSVFRYLPNRLGFFDMYGNGPDISLTRFDYPEPILNNPIPTVNVVLQAEDNITYHGGRAGLPSSAKTTNYRGPAMFSPRAGKSSLISCLRITQTLPIDLPTVLTDKDD